MRVAALVFRDDRRHDRVAAGKRDADPQDALLIFSQVRGTRLALGKRITGGIEVKEEAAS